MPFFSKMMGSYPMQLIRGLSPSVRMSAGIGAGIGAGYGAMSARRNRVGRAAGYGVAGGAIGMGGMMGFAAMGGMGGLRTFGRNMMRPGMAGMYGRSAMGAARTGVGSAMARLRGMI